ncbi:MAG: NAD(P)/FAD-dependent oxidoreductase [Thermofilaceae archaeon]
MSLKVNYDIVISGAGVSGLFFAYHASKAGFSTILVETKSEDRVGEKVCGDAVGEHHFKAVGLENPRVGLDATGTIKGVRVFSPSRKYYITAWGNGYALDRKAFGQRLLKMALDAGAELLADHQVQKPIIEKKRVNGVLVTGKKGLIEVKSKIVVDSTGATAAVRTKLPPEWWVSYKAPLEDFNVAYRVIASIEEEQDPSLAYIILNAEVAPGGYWWWFPKDKYTVNFGLGVKAGKGAPNPRIMFEKHLLSELTRVKGKVLHEGGGLVPTRRLAPCVIWNGFIAVGDAAYTANPLHGGGIGPALVSSYHAAKVTISALENGRTDMEYLWPYQKAYLDAYGIKQAMLDVVRIYVQGLTNDDLELIVKSGVVSDDELSSLGYRGELVAAVITKLVGAIRLLRKPSLLSQITKLKNYMDKARSIYSEFPQEPKGFEKWFKDEEELYYLVKEEFWK